MMPSSFISSSVRATISSLSLGLATLAASGLPVAVDPSLADLHYSLRAVAESEA